MEGGAGADFVVGVGGGCADFSVGEEFAGHGFAHDEEFDGVAHGDFAEVEGNVALAPGHFELGFDGVQGDFFAELLEAFFVEFDAVHVEADEEFV